MIGADPVLAQARARRPWAPRADQPAVGAPPVRRRSRILHHAIYGPALRTPHWSAARRVMPGQGHALAIGAATAAALLLIAPGFLGAAAMAGFGALIVFRVWAALTARPLPETSAAPHALPRYTVIVPLYREAGMVPGLVAALGAMDYPTALLDIILVAEEDDAPTLAAVRRLAPAHTRLIAVPPAAPRTKPKALNYALAFARGSLLAIYDAEDRPDPTQLRAAAAAFAEGGAGLVCVQAPLAFYNARENFFTRCFALEYAIHFRLMLPALLRMGAPIPLGGTSNHFRTDALRAAGGWDPFNVTEDADLGFRLGGLGGRVGMIAPPTLEEATCRSGAWVRQRSRWLKGYAQTILVHTRRGAGPMTWRKAASLWLTLGGALAAAIVHTPALVWLLCSGARAMAGGPPPSMLALALMGAGYASVAITGAAAARLSGDRGLFVSILLTPFYWPFQTVAAGVALTQLVTAPFRWEKTEHGVSRMAPSIRGERAPLDHEREEGRPVGLLRPVEHGGRRGRKSLA